MSNEKKIIVIDDEPDTVTFLTTLLEDNGYITVSSFDGQEGIEKTRSEQPDLILLDITMPEKSGVKFYREVREDPELNKIPVIIVTGISQDFEKFISTRRQIPPPNGYINKPVDKKELLEAQATGDAVKTINVVKRIIFNE